MREWAWSVGWAGGGCCTGGGGVCCGRGGTKVGGVGSAGMYVCSDVRGRAMVGVVKARSRLLFGAAEVDAPCGDAVFQKPSVSGSGDAALDGGSPRVDARSAGDIGDWAGDCGSDGNTYSLSVGVVPRGVVAVGGVSVLLGRKRPFGPRGGSLRDSLSGLGGLCVYVVLISLNTCMSRGVGAFAWWC